MHWAYRISWLSRLPLGVGLGAAEPFTDATPAPSSDFVHAAAVATKSGNRQTISNLLLIGSVEQGGRNGTVTVPVTLV